MESLQQTPFEFVSFASKTFVLIYIMRECRAMPLPSHVERAVDKYDAILHGIFDKLNYCN